MRSFERIDPKTRGSFYQGSDASHLEPFLSRLQALLYLRFSKIEG
jgi:hypothetical protein